MQHKTPQSGSGTRGRRQTQEHRRWVLGRSREAVKLVLSQPEARAPVLSRTVVLQPFRNGSKASVPSSRGGRWHFWVLLRHGKPGHRLRHTVLTGHTWHKTSQGHRFASDGAAGRQGFAFLSQVLNNGQPCINLCRMTVKQPILVVTSPGTG